MSICQFTEIVLGFLARVVRADPVSEQVTIVMSEKSFFQSRCPPFKVLLILQEKRNVYRNKDLTCFFIWCQQKQRIIGFYWGIEFSMVS